MAGPDIKRLYFSLSDVSRMTHLRPNVIRAWEETYGRIRPVKGKSGRLLFRPKDVDIIKLIKKFQNCGYSEKTIKELLHNPRLDYKSGSKRTPDVTPKHAILVEQLTSGLEEIISILDKH